MTHQDYLKLPGINATSIKAGRKSMRHMREAMLGRVDDDAACLGWGRLIHIAVLEPSRLENEVVVYDGRKQGKKWDEFQLAHANVEIVKPEELLELRAIRASVMRNSDAARLIETTTHEIALTWTRAGYGDAKARYDGYNDKMFFDLKSTSTIEPRRFSSQFFALGYDLQYGHYFEGLPVPNQFCIAVESSAPFDCIVYRVPEHVVERGRVEAVQIATKYKCCELTNCWPGIADGIVELEVPAWASIGEEEVSTSTGTIGVGEL